jgi:hypothetical protein
MSWLPPLLAVAAAAALALTACTSTQEKASRLSDAGSAAFSAKGLRIERESKVVRVGRTTVLKSGDLVAAVVQLRNTAKRRLRNVPILIDVKARGGKTIFRNDAPGLERSLVGISLLEPGQEVFWVNDQVLATGRPGKVRAKVGQAPPAPKRVPRIEVTPPRFERDSVSGLSVVGTVHNRSNILQKKLTLYAVARKGRRIVAAGRGAIERLKPGRKAGYQIFFVGDPRGAKVTLAVPPTTFRQEPQR